MDGDPEDPQCAGVIRVNEAAFLIGLMLLWSIALCLLVLGLSQHRTASIIRTRMDSVAVGRTDPGRERPPSQVSLPHLYHGLVAPALDRIGSMMSWVNPSLSHLDRLLADAGHPLDMHAVELLGLNVLSLLMGGGLGILIILKAPTSLVQYTIPLLIAFCALGYSLPRFVLQRMARDRRRAIRYSLPDMLDLLIINIEAGIGLEGAIARSIERLQIPLTFELHRVLTEINAGKSRLLSLREMAERLRIEEFSLIIASIQQSEQMGTSIGGALRQQAQQLRRRRSNELREIAAKLPTKLLFPIVFFIFPTLFMVLLGPAAILAFRTVGSAELP